MAVFYPGNSTPYLQTAAFLHCVCLKTKATVPKQRQLPSRVVLWCTCTGIFDHTSNLSECNLCSRGVQLTYNHSLPREHISDDELEVYKNVKGGSISTVAAQEKLSDLRFASSCTLLSPYSPVLLQNLNEGTTEQHCLRRPLTYSCWKMKLKSNPESPSKLAPHQ